MVVTNQCSPAMCVIKFEQAENEAWNCSLGNIFSAVVMSKAAWERKFVYSYEYTRLEMKGVPPHYTRVERRNYDVFVFVVNTTKAN